MINDAKKYLLQCMQYLHLIIVKEGKIHCKFNTYIVMKKLRKVSLKIQMTKRLAHLQNDENNVVLQIEK